MPTDKLIVFRFWWTSTCMWKEDPMNRLLCWDLNYLFYSLKWFYVTRSRVSSSIIKQPRQPPRPRTNYRKSCIHYSLLPRTGHQNHPLYGFRCFQGLKGLNKWINKNNLKAGLQSKVNIHDWKDAHFLFKTDPFLCRNRLKRLEVIHHQ